MSINEIHSLVQESKCYEINSLYTWIHKNKPTLKITYSEITTFFWNHFQSSRNEAHDHIQKQSIEEFCESIFDKSVDQIKESPCYRRYSFANISNIPFEKMKCWSIDKKEKLFIHCLESHQIDLLKRLLDNKIIHVEKNNHFSIRWAAKKGKIEILKVLLDHQKKYGIKIDNSQAILLSIENNHLEILKLLLQHQKRRTLKIDFLDLKFYARHNSEMVLLFEEYEQIHFLKNQN